MPNDTRLINDLARHIGQTVTIFTTSGGQSGRGFTGVLASVTCNFVRLINELGPAPGCALGNCCEERDHHRDCDRDRDRDNDRDRDIDIERDRDRDRNRFECTGRRGLGSIVDIPVESIAAFVHNAVGSGW